MFLNFNVNKQFYFLSLSLALILICPTSALEKANFIRLKTIVEQQNDEEKHFFLRRTAFVVQRQMETPLLRLPAILPSSDSILSSDRPFSETDDLCFPFPSPFILFAAGRDYDAWRAKIHRELEENLQRQVQELIEETERKEREEKRRRFDQR